MSDDAGPFRWGVGSFDPRTDGVLLWTAVEGGGLVRWQVATDPDLANVIRSGEAQADAECGTLTVEVSGLHPATTYWYRFDAEGRSSPVGRTRTLPGGAAGRLRIGAVCCARFAQSPFAVYRAVAESDVDLVLHLGDYIYEDAKKGLPDRRPDPPHEALTLADYRRRHAQHRLDPDLQALHAAHPMVVIWDDHDIADNATSDGSPSHDEAELGPWADRVAAALQAHNEFLPKRLADPADPASAWRALDAGPLVRLVCTETRVAGRDGHAGAGDDTTRADDPHRSLLGDAQREWLLPIVADQDPGWVLVASGTVVSDLEIASPDSLDGILPEKYEVVDGRGRNTDQWDGYQAERARLVAALDERSGRGCVVLSGDIHSAWAIEGPAGPSGSAVAVELVCPPAATTPLGKLLPPGVGALLGPALRRDLTAAKWVDVDHHGYLVVDVAPDRLTATFWWVDPEGDGAAVRASTWAVLPGQPGRLHRIGVAEDVLGGAVGPLEPIRRHRRRRRFRLAGLAAGAAMARWALRHRR